MDRKLTTTPRHVLVFSVAPEVGNGQPVNIRIPREVSDKIREHVRKLGPGEKINESLFNLPEGVTLVAHSVPDGRQTILAIDGEEVMRSFDRNREYVPEELRTPAPWQVELGERPEHRRLIACSYGLADEWNRDKGTWKWADVTPEQDGSHWSRFDGHMEQVDINVSTYNARTQNDWNGRDEIRAYAEWTVALDRVQVGSGWARTWEAAHRAAADYVRKLQDLGPFSGLNESWREADKLIGRPVWYREQPAVITSLVLDQGCVIVKPTMAERFAPEPHYGRDVDTTEYDSAKVELLSPHLWWYRDDADKDLYPHTPSED